MSAIPIEKWAAIMWLPIFMRERDNRWRSQRDAYPKSQKNFPPPIWLMKDRILHPLGPQKKEKINYYYKKYHYLLPK